MTVENDNAYGGDVVVVWFAGSKMETKTVDPETLELFAEPEKK